MYKDKIKRHIITKDIERTKMAKEEFDEKFDRKRQVFSRGLSSKRGKYETEQEVELEYESKLEKRFIKMLDDSEEVIGIRTQGLELEYYYWGKDREYYPDIIYLTKEGQVNILEIKPYEAMLEIAMKVKYNRLKEYCKDMGFGYAMLEDRGSIEEIRKRDLNIRLQEEMQAIMKERNTIYHKRIPGLMDRHRVDFEDIIRVAIEENWQFRSPRSRVWSYSIKRQQQKDIVI